MQQQIQQQQFNNIYNILKQGANKQYGFVQAAKQTLKGSMVGGGIGFLSGFGVKFGIDPIITKSVKPIYIAQIHNPNKEKITKQIEETTNEINQKENNIKQISKNSTETEKEQNNKNTQ